MKTVKFIGLCIIAAGCCFYAGVTYQKVNDDQLFFERAVTTQKVLRDYQFELLPAVDYKTAPDSIQVFDGDRPVGIVPILEDSPIGILIYQDNE